MAKTYAQLTREIEGLKAKADAARKREASDVIARIKDAIEVYGLTAADLGLEGSGSGAANLGKSDAPKAAQKKPAQKQKTKLAVRYQDDAGNTWTGRGSKPRWLTAALAAGQPLQAFTVDATDGKEAVADPANASRKSAASQSKVKKQQSRVKYKDDAGHTWSGYGPKPGWLQAAIASGKTLEEMSA